MIKSFLKRMIVGVVLLLFAFCADGQINDPVIWTYTAKRTAAKTYELHFTASINISWRLYGQGNGKDMEPATLFTFVKNPLLNFDGQVKEVGKIERYYDKNLKAELSYYTNRVDFVQTIKIKTAVATVVRGNVNFVVCNDRSCLPPKNAPFAINIGGK